MRERAQAALPGPWLTGRSASHLADSVIFGQSRDWPGHIVQVADADYGHNQVADTDYIASMHPGVALAVADWLDAYAERFALWKGPHVSAELRHALKVARAYLTAGES